MNISLTDKFSEFFLVFFGLLKWLGQQSPNGELAITESIKNHKAAKNFHSLTVGHKKSVQNSFLSLARLIPIKLRVCNIT